MQVSPILLALAFSLSTCARESTSPGGAGAHPTPLETRHERAKGQEPAPPTPVSIALPLEGLSGLTADPSGALWAIAEDERAMLRIDPVSGRWTVFEIRGLPAHVEAESLAWISPGRFVIGTEAERAGGSDEAYYVHRVADVMHVERTFLFDYTPWNLSAGDDAGVEGICSAGDHLVAVSEVVGRHGGRRFAPLAMRTRDGSWSRHRLWLSSATGKISGIDCSLVDGSVEVLAIERHFGVTRVLRFDVLGEDLEPEIVADWDAALAGDSPNLEGIARVPGGTYFIADNVYRDRRSSLPPLWRSAM